MKETRGCPRHEAIQPQAQELVSWVKAPLSLLRQGTKPAGLFEDLRQRAQGLLDQVDWSREPAQDALWSASRAGGLSVLSGPDFHLVIGDSNCCINDFLAIQAPHGELWVGYGDENWRLTADGLVRDGSCLAVVDNQAEQAAQSLGTSLGRLGRSPLAEQLEPPTGDSWTEQLLGNLDWIGPVVDLGVKAVSPVRRARSGPRKRPPLPERSNRCPACQAALPHASHFCPQCGHSVPGGPS